LILKSGYLKMQKIIQLIFVIIFTTNIINAQTPLIADKKDYSAVKMQQLWKIRTTGTNLASGKSIAFAPSPRYHLTVKGNSDSNDLTDGYWEKRKNQAIWWSPKAVGWDNLSNPKKIIIDLGKPECVGKIVWRVVAGSKKRAFRGPKRVKLYGSMDGKKVYLVNERYRWSEDNARPDNYRLPNIGRSDTGTDVYVYPLVIGAKNYRMRYVIIEFEQDCHWMCSDELAVIEGKDSGKSIRELPAETMQTADIWIKSPEPCLPVIKGIMLPLWFRQTDFRKNGKRLPVNYRFLLPPGIKLHVPKVYKSKINDNEVIVQARNGGNSSKIGPFFFELEKDLKTPVKVKYQAKGTGAVSQPIFTITLEAKEPIANFKLKKLTISIGWMIDAWRNQWLDFANSYGRLGFNTVPSFPRGWSKQAANRGYDLKKIENSPTPSALTKAGKKLNQLRKAGYKIIYMESPLHVVNWLYSKESVEFRCQSKPVPTINSFCPAYRGKYYVLEMERIKKCFLLMGGADYVMWDCELLGSAKWNGIRCSRCQKAFAASGKPWIQFVKSKTIEMLRDMNKKIAVAASKHKWQQPQIGMYGVDSLHFFAAMLKFPVNGLFGFQNPSLYVGNNPLEIHKKIRQCRKLSKSNNIIPWLSTNTGGKVSPVNVRIMIWEALINGSCGITYYSLFDFNPAQLYEVSRALAAIAPVEDIVFYGKPAYNEFKITSGTARISATRLGKKAILLLVNPTKQKQKITWLHKSGKKNKIEIPAQEAELIIISL
jgi:hypothetical protein